MGLFRFWLACCVMIGHIVGGNPDDAFVRDHVLNAVLAVEVFFAVSGFYMYFVIHEVYGKRRDFIPAFYASRALRIFPAYWLLLALTVLLVPNQLTDALRSGDALTRYEYILENIFLFRADAIPEMWAIKVELMFYLLCPFLLTRSTKFITAIILLSLASKLYFVANGKWVIHVLPGELCVFLTGSLLARFYLRHREKLRAIMAGKWHFAIGGFAVWTLAYSFAYVHLPDDPLNLRYGIYFLSALPFIPLLFEYTRSNRVDRMIGELSYPIYLCHPLMIKLAGAQTLTHMSLIVIPATLLAALLIARFIDAPIDRYRHLRFAAT